MRFKQYLLAVMLSVLVPLGAATAQRGGGGGGDNWEFLGQKTGGIGRDGDSIVINQHEDWHRDRGFDKLKFTADGGDIDLNALRIHYINGHVEEMRVDRQIRRGGELVLDLPGTRSYLRQIDMQYRSAIGISFGSGGLRLQQGSISVHGQRVRRAPPPEPIGFVRSGGGNWRVLDSQEISRRDDTVTLRGTGRGGDSRVGQIRLKAERGEIEVRSMAVRFRNGETQHIRVDKLLEDGETSRAFDLEGDLRGVDTVVVNLEPARGRGRGRDRERADLALYGSSNVSAEPGRGGDRGDPYLARGYTLIGEQTVGFTTDRDQINVGQSDDWNRRNRFGRLHFVATGNDVHLMGIRLIYQNGYAEDIRVDQTVRAGGDFMVPLQGERSFIRTIEMTYRSRPGFGGRAVMKVYGESGRR